MRIFDRVASGETIWNSPGVDVSTEMQIFFRKAAHTYQRIVCDEAAQYQAQSDRSWTPMNGDYGIMRPPFTRAWLEYKMPNTLIADGVWQKAEPLEQRFAVLLEQDDVDSFSLLTIFTHGDRTPLAVFPLAVDIRNFDDPANMSERARMLHSSRGLLGRFANDELSTNTGLLSLLGPAYLSLGWMNCRGMGTEPAQIPEWQRRKRARKGQPIGMDYRRIVIDERIRRALEYNRTAERSGKRLHMVRGHIRSYTAERPAFGNWVGNMWIHPHLRGDEQFGRINHEYDVASRGPR